MKTIVLHGRPVTSGRAEGTAIVTKEALGSYGAFNIYTSEGLEEGHDFLGKEMRSKVVVFGGAKGSSSWSVWFQALRLTGAAPAALLMRTSNSQTALGSVVLRIPAITDFDQDPTEVIADGDLVTVDADAGIVEVRKSD